MTTNPPEQPAASQRPAWTTTPAPAPTPPPPTTQPAAWYPDPWQHATWRWYDGSAWTAHTSTPLESVPAVEQKKPRLPSFLSVPVLICGLPSIAMLAYAAVTNLVPTLLGIVPLLIVVPVLVWMDRVEPEPWSSRLHTLLWGAFVAGLISLVFNTGFAFAVAAAIGDGAAAEVWAAVISAPFIEEITNCLLYTSDAADD